MSADRNLLFGVLALQLDFISRDQLIAGMQSWVNDKGKPLAQILEAAGALDVANRQLLEPLVARHIKQHANDPQQSLAEGLAGSSLKHDLVATLSAGQATSDGLRFRIVRKYREGGLGIVSVAQDSELDREVALKEMSPAMPTTRADASGSCGKRKSPAVWNTRTSSQFTAWALTTTAAPSMRCGSSAATPA